MRLRVRAILCGQRAEHLGAHPGPLFTGTLKRMLRGFDEAFADRFVMMMTGHAPDIGAGAAGRKS